MKASREQASEGNFNLFTKPGMFVRIRHHSLARWFLELLIFEIHRRPHTQFRLRVFSIAQITPGGLPYQNVWGTLYPLFKIVY